MSTGRTPRWPASAVPQHRPIRQEGTVLRADQVEDTWGVTPSSVGTAVGGRRETQHEGAPAGPPGYAGGAAEEGRCNTQEAWLSSP